VLKKAITPTAFSGCFPGWDHERGPNRWARFRYACLSQCRYGDLWKTGEQIP